MVDVGPAGGVWSEYFMKKYLVIRFSSIGDIVLTTPVVRCLKEQTGAEVHYLSKQQFRGILAPNPHIDKLHVIKEDVAEIIEQHIEQNKPVERLLLKKNG